MRLIVAVSRWQIGQWDVSGGGLFTDHTRLTWPTLCSWRMISIVTRSARLTSVFKGCPWRPIILLITQRTLDGLNSSWKHGKTIYVISNQQWTYSLILEQFFFKTLYSSIPSFTNRNTLVYTWSTVYNSCKILQTHCFPVYVFIIGWY